MWPIFLYTIKRNETKQVLIFCIDLTKKNSYCLKGLNMSDWQYFLPVIDRFPSGIITSPLSFLSFFFSSWTLVWVGSDKTLCVQYQTVPLKYVYIWEGKWLSECRYVKRKRVNIPKPISFFLSFAAFFAIVLSFSWPFTALQPMKWEQFQQINKCSLLTMS